MTAPKRIQRRRTKTWRMPNGTIYVGRPTKWGNPFVAGEYIDNGSDLWPYLVSPLEPDSLRRSIDTMARARISTKARAVDCYGWWIIQQPALMLALHELAGHDLACWCPLDKPCHADVLLELANDDEAAA